jgi:hypothetical protein
MTTIAADLLAATEHLNTLLTRHPNTLGTIVNASTQTTRGGRPVVKVQVESFSTANRETAAALLAWFYLLDNATVCAYEYSSGQNIEVRGELDGIAYAAYTGIFDRGVRAYVHKCIEDYAADDGLVPVSMLRRLQVGDVPAVEAVSA